MKIDISKALESALIKVNKVNDGANCYDINLNKEYAKRLKAGERRDFWQGRADSYLTDNPGASNEDPYLIEVKNIIGVLTKQKPMQNPKIHTADGFTREVSFILVTMYELKMFGVHTKKNHFEKHFNILNIYEDYRKAKAEKSNKGKELIDLIMSCCERLKDADLDKLKEKLEKYKKNNYI